MSAGDDVSVLLVSYLYGCLPEGLQPLPAALLHVDHIPVVALQRPLQAVQRLEHQVLALIQLLLKNLQGVNLNVGEGREETACLNCCALVLDLGFRKDMWRYTCSFQLSAIRTTTLKLSTILI